MHLFDLRWRRLQDGWDFDVRTVEVTEPRPYLFKVLTIAIAVAGDLHAHRRSTNLFFTTTAKVEKAPYYVFVEVVAPALQKRGAVIPGCIRFSVFVFIASRPVTNKFYGSWHSSHTNAVIP
jgi:hypothetical protein